MNQNYSKDTVGLRPEEWREAAEELLVRAREIGRRSAERALAEDTQTSAALPADSTNEHKPVR